MINAIILIFVGGAIGAMTREFLMLGVPDPADGFPMPIFVANILASFLLGLITALHQRRTVSDDVNTLVGTGVMGGLSTFSSFVYGALVIMNASVAGLAIALAYLTVSLVAGYAAVWAGFRLGMRKAA